MEQVNISTVRPRLSDYVKRAAAGESFEIVASGYPTGAMLGPVQQQSTLQQDLEEAHLELTAQKADMKGGAE